MKFAAASAVLGVLATCALAEPQPSPKLPEWDRASVTLPYAELRALWEAGQRKAEVAPTPAPPVSFVLHRADCELRLGASSSTLVAEFDVESLEAKWQTIALLGGAAQLENAEAGPRSVISIDDGYAVLTNQVGKAPVSLQLTTRGATSLTPQAPLSLNIANATVKRLRVSGIPAGMQARVGGQLAKEIKDGVAIFSLPSARTEVTIQLEAQRVEAAPTPSQWQAQSQMLVRYGEGRLRYRSQLFAHANDGSGLEMAIEIPANASAVAVEGQDIAGWTNVRSTDGRRSVVVNWKTRDVLDREIVVEYTTPQSPMAEKWTLQAPATGNQTDARNLYVVLPSEGLEIKGEGVRTGIDTRRLPEWMRNQIGGSAFFTVEGGAQLALQPNWLPAMATAEAIVTESNCSLRLVADGALQTTTNYTIRHAAPLAWKLELPANVELLSCNVAGHPARPVQREPGVIELNLAAPPESAKGVTSVSLAYTARSKALDPVSGEIALELPRTTLFIERLEWSIDIPEAFEITAADGNVSVVSRATDKPDVVDIALRKDLCRGERPAVALFYQRRSINN